MEDLSHSYSWPVRVWKSWTGQSSLEQAIWNTMVLWSFTGRKNETTFTITDEVVWKLFVLPEWPQSHPADMEFANATTLECFRRPWIVFRLVLWRVSLAYYRLRVVRALYSLRKLGLVVSKKCSLKDHCTQGHWEIVT